MHNKIPVENYSDLYRCDDTGAIINTNSVELEIYLAQRNKIQSERAKSEALATELSIVKNDLTKLQELVTQLLNKDK